MTHLPTDDLLRWRDAPSEADRARVTDHLAACDRCAGRYAELIRTQPIDEPAPTLDVAAFAARGHAMGVQPVAGRVIRPARWWLTRVLPLAAAVLLAAIVVPRLNLRDEGTVLRGGEGAVKMLRPVGIIAGADELSFEWTQPPGVDRVRLLVFDLKAPSRPLVDRDVTGTRYDPSPEERHALAGERVLLWFVEYRTPQSTTVTSPATRFTVK